jgi:hypothetical protein
MEGELMRLDNLVRCERDTKVAIGKYYDDLDTTLTEGTHDPVGAKQ